MNEKIKIKLPVADRFYSVVVESDAQKKSLEEATNHIQQMTKTIEASYAVRDKQDLLAMCVLQSTKNMQTIEQQQHKLKQRLQSLNSFIDKQFSDGSQTDNNN